MIIDSSELKRSVKGRYILEYPELVFFNYRDILAILEGSIELVIRPFVGIPQWTL